MEGGADQALRDNGGHTPLHAVARCGKLNVTQRLLEFGLDVNEEDDEGLTWLDECRAVVQGFLTTIAGAWCRHRR